MVIDFAGGKPARLLSPTPGNLPSEFIGLGINELNKMAINNNNKVTRFVQIFTRK